MYVVWVQILVMTLVSLSKALITIIALKQVGKVLHFDPPAKLLVHDTHAYMDFKGVTLFQPKEYMYM